MDPVSRAAVSSDTSPDARQVQIEIWRRLGPSGRVALAVEMSENVRSIAMDGVRRRHPEYSGEEIRHAVFRMMLGDDLYQQAWPDRPLLRP